METTTTPDRPAIPFTAPSGAVYLLPESNAHLIYRNGEPDEISEATMMACFPRVLSGDAVNGISRNPVTELFEVRVNGAIVFKGDSMMECRHNGYHFERAAAPLIEAVNESDRQDEAIAPGLSSFEPAPDEDDYHSTEPAVKAAAGKCFGAMARRKLVNDDQEMRLALLSLTNEFHTTRKTFTAEDYNKLTTEIELGTWECKPGCSSWLRVLFTEKPEGVGTVQERRAA